ncbi:MFS transporter [Demequina aurantiaca]|uniref:MFS transporter n=1 Tax=Demequina aurantiaca TaxID=676200 RepID=UPI003D34CC8E
MTENTTTLELDVTRLRAQMSDDGIDDGPLNERDWYDEAEATTMSIPGVVGGETVVVEEDEPGRRSPESLGITQRRAKIALAVLAVGAFATGANEASIVALSPNIASGLGVPVAAIGLLATAFAFTVVFATMPLTLLSTRFSKRKTLTATFAVWTVGLVLTASATGMAQMTSGRIVSGAAHALFWAVVAPTAASLFAPHLRAKSVTRILVGAAAAGVIGTPLVTIAGENIGWQAPYWALAALGLILGAALWLVMPDIKPRRKSDPDQSEQEVVRGDVPSLPAFIRVLVVTFVAAVAMTSTWTYIVPFYKDVAGVNSSQLPLLFALGGVIAVASTLAISPFLARFAVYSVAAGIAMLAFAWAVLLFAQPWAAVTAQVFQAAGWSVVLASLLNWAMRHSPWRTEVGAGTYTVTMNAGAGVGPVLGGVVVTTWGTVALPWMSLGLTAIAGVITASVDQKMLKTLRVPSKVRRALAKRDALRARRREWQRRTAVAVKVPAGAVRAAGAVTLQTVGQGAAVAGKSVAKASTTAGKTVAKASATAGKTVAKAGANAGKSTAQGAMVAGQGAAKATKTVAKSGVTAGKTVAKSGVKAGKTVAKSGVSVGKSARPSTKAQSRPAASSGTHDISDQDMPGQNALVHDADRDRAVAPGTVEECAVENSTVENFTVERS